MHAIKLAANAMAVSIGIAMDNAATNQHNGQNIATACMTVCCKLILSQAGQ